MAVQFGARLREKRKAKGVTQEWMAKYLSIHRTTYTKYESGEIEPPLGNLCLLADILGCTVDELLRKE